MNPSPLRSRLSHDQLRIVECVRQKASELLDHSPRFRYFTLHGTPHIDSLFRILGLLLDSGLQLPQRDLYLLSLALCTHDLGMVVSLRNCDFSAVSEGRPGFADPVAFEHFVRETHHNLIQQYVQRDLNFLVSLGISPPDLSVVAEIGRAHRKIHLDQMRGTEQRLGALLRVIDELDVGPSRAPAQVLENIADELDPISCWHWFKHNITLDWDLGNNVNIVEVNGRKTVRFEIVVRPTQSDSIPYWLTQVHRPIRKALVDEGAAQIIHAFSGIEIAVTRNEHLSREIGLSPQWRAIEARALSQGRKVVLIVDDEVRKYDDVFYPLMDEYYVVRVPNPRAALEAIQATSVKLAIVDLQMGSGGLWTEAETAEFKMTGIKLIREIRSKYPRIKIGILTGSRHPLPDIDDIDLAFFVRKPIDPVELFDIIRSNIEGGAQ